MTEHTNQLHSEFPEVGKSIIENELRKTKGDFPQARETVESISKSIIQTDQILNEDDKLYQLQDCSSSEWSDSDEDFSNSSESKDSDDKELDSAKSENMISDSEIDKYSIEISKKYSAIPIECIRESIRYFYPNEDKIEQVLSEFQKHLYSKDKIGKSKRGHKKATKNDIDVKLNPELAQEVEDLYNMIEDGKRTMEKTDLKALRYRLKGLKKIQRIERKDSKRKIKDEKSKARDEKKKKKIEEKITKKAQKQVRKAEKMEKREANQLKKGEKGYEDDVFFREIRIELNSIKDQLKTAKKNYKKAVKKNVEEDIIQYQKEMAELEQVYLQEMDKVIKLNYQRYNKEEERKTRLDLHGLRKVEAIRQVEKMLAERATDMHDSDEMLDIITGRGNHSGRAVLKMAVKDYLLDHNIPYTELHNGAGYQIK